MVNNLASFHCEDPPERDRRVAKATASQAHREPERTTMSLSNNSDPSTRTDTPAPVEATYYLSPTGSDETGTGAAAAPWASLQKARDHIRSNHPTQTGDVHVLLNDGTYRVDDTVVFTASNSGKNGWSVIYGAANEATPVLSGGVDLSQGWTLHDAAAGIYKRSGVDWVFRQLYINGERGIRARTPNREDPITGEPYYQTKNGTYPYRVESALLGPWTATGVAEMVILSHWKQHRGRISAHSGDTISFHDPECGFAFNHIPQPTSPFFFENAYEFLDAEGEWFLDESADTLFYKPRAGETMNETTIVAPAVETILRIEGRESEKVRNLVFKGLTFRHTNWLAPCEYGYVDTQAGYRYQTESGGSSAEIRNTARYEPAGAMLQLRFAGDVLIDHNRFELGGGWGIMGQEGTDHVSISWNHFSSMAGGAIALGISGDEWDAQPSTFGQSRHDTVINNTIDAVALDYSDNVGIGAMNAEHLTVAQNLLRNLPYTGISIGWSWDDEPSGMTNNIIKGNRIHDVVKLHDDGAGIYSLGRQDSSIYSHNYIHNLAGSKYNGGAPIVGIYFDNGSAYKIAEHNVLDWTENAFYANNPPNHDNLFTCNYHNTAFGNIGTNVSRANTAVPGSDWPLDAIDVISKSGPGKRTG